ncbi:MAG: hypothetical protein D6725_12945 [Planctomycetota bacterium]|nr:MAG: hypothetical protein D6725_12945 [Planctomycetota bacterium]
MCAKSSQFPQFALRRTAAGSHDPFHPGRWAFAEPVGVTAGECSKCRSGQADRLMRRIALPNASDG